MIRWSYLIPRLSFILVVVGGFYFGFDPLARFGLRTAGQRMTGARVDIGQFRSNFRSGNVTLSQLAVANPKRPVEDMFKCAELSFDLNNDALLRKNWVVDRGALHGIELGNLRTEDGSLPTEPEDPNAPPGWSDQVTAAGEAWVKKTGQQMSADIENELQSPALARELRERWPREYQQLEERARKVRDDGKSLEQDSQRWKDDPLSAIEQIPQIITRVDNLRQEVVAIKQQLSQFRTQADHDRRAIQEARQHDQQYLKERLTPSQLQPEQLTKYLVGPEWKPYVDQLIGWIEWGRGHMSNRPQNSVAAGRGLDIDFFSAHPRPRWLVKVLDLDGSGQANGQPFTFRGQLTDLTSDPQILQKPAKLSVELAGAHQAHVEVLIDHTGEVPQELVTIQCPRIVRHAARLGDDDSLALNVAPGEASLGIQLKLVGDQLQGNIAMQQPRVELTPAVNAQHDIAPLQTAFAEAAANVKQFDVNIQLQGYWKKPAWNIHSNLGRDLAGGVNQAVRAELTRRGDTLIERADSEVNQQVAEWQKELESKQQAILADLQLSEEQLTWLKEQLKTVLPIQGLPVQGLPLPGLPGGLESGKSAVKDALRKVLR